MRNVCCLSLNEAAIECLMFCWFDAYSLMGSFARWSGGGGHLGGDIVTPYLG
jgi:hypothetical protein